LHHFIKPEPVPVTCVLGFKTAKLNNTAQQVEISIYGINSDDITPATLPLQLTTVSTPTNINLFGTANTVLLGTIIIPAGANNNWVNQNITFTPNSKEFPSVDSIISKLHEVTTKEKELLIVLSMIFVCIKNRIKLSKKA
jgi:hypothetical protein